MDLHSIMFLLIRIIIFLLNSLDKFTFHYVSINTVIDIMMILNSKYLHSIMFLLIPFSFFEWLSSPFSFTFHYVSINTLFWALNYPIFLIFTFHYVSINTYTTHIHSIVFLHLHSIMFLLILSVHFDVRTILNDIYIPLCFY